jgi:hypothetical protein
VYVRFESEGKNGKRALAILRLWGLFDRPASIGVLPKDQDAKTERLDIRYR